MSDSGGNTSRAISFYGNIAFSAGTYTLSSGDSLQDSGGGFSVSSTGTYSVSASGYGFLSNPLIAGGFVRFLVSNKIIVGGDTESGYNDMFIAAPVTSTLANSSFQGAYTISAYTPGGTAATSADFTYQLNPNGAGTLGTVSISGYSGAGSTITQSSSGVKYAFSNGANIISFPTSNSANFYSGQVFMYMSPDSNFVFGGTPGGYDMFVGVHNASGAGTLSGLYYETGLDDNELNGLDTYYGVFNAFQQNVIGNERIVYSNAGSSTATGFNYYTTYPANISGTYTDPSNTVNYTLGQDGIRIGYGTGGYLGIEVALPYSAPTVTATTYLDPSGIVNTASSAPYTAGISPGDFITIYNGTGLANSTVFAPPGAFPTTLGGVTVTVDGFLQAPLYYVSPTQISFLVPYAASTYSVASIQVNNNGATSNIATTYVNLTTPGVFTANPVGGIGYAAMLDFPATGGYFVVGANNPANPGDNVALYLTGLGAPFPSNGDGALGPTTGDGLVQTINVDISGTDVGTLAYQGLAPGLAGLYQINFQIPAATPAGNNSLGITGPDSYTNEALIPISSGSTAAARTSSESTPAAHTRVLPRLKKSVSH